MTLIERFDAYTERIPFSGCWIWMGSQINHHGYGMIWYRRRLPGQRPYGAAHRVAYELFIGKIPAGQCVLHKCDVRCCVNPAHLWVGTVAQNNKDRDLKCRDKVSLLNAAKTHCSRGHLFSGENLRKKGSWRICIACVSIRNKAYRLRKFLDDK